MATLLLHLQPLPVEVAQELAAQGIISLQVDDLDSFRIMSLDKPLIPVDDFLTAALDALRAAGADTSKGAHRLVTNLATLAEAEQQKKARQ